MTRAFRSIAVLALCAMLIAVSISAHPVLDDATYRTAAVVVAAANVLDLALLWLFPGYCRIGDRIRYIPLSTMALLFAVLVYVCRLHPPLWQIMLLDTLLAAAICIADGLYQDKKSKRGRNADPAN